jgi:hypothetical protein
MTNLLRYKGRSPNPKDLQEVVEDQGDPFVIQKMAEGGHVAGTGILYPLHPEGTDQAEKDHSDEVGPAFRQARIGRYGTQRRI